MNQDEKRANEQLPPGPQGHFLLDSLCDITGDPLTFLTQNGSSSLPDTPVRYIALLETDDQDRARRRSPVSLASSFGSIIGSALAGAFLGSNALGVAGIHNIYPAVAAATGLGLLASLALGPRVQTERGET